MPEGSHQGEGLPEKSKDGKAPLMTRKRFLFLAAGAVVGGGAIGLSLYERGDEESREIKRIERETGVNLRDLAERSHFTLGLQILNSRGPYVLHIGQMHSINDPEGIQEADEIIKVQQNIERCILELQAKTADRNVFYEGFSDQEINFLRKW